MSAYLFPRVSIRSRPAPTSSFYDLRDSTLTRWLTRAGCADRTFIYLFILPILLRAALLPNRQCGDRKCGGSPVSEGGWGEKCALGTRVLALSPHQHILLNLYKHTFRTSTLTYLTLLMRYGEHNQSLPWISSPALCRRWGEENGEFMQS